MFRGVEQVQDTALLMLCSALIANRIGKTKTTITLLTTHQSLIHLLNAVLLLLLLSVLYFVNVSL